MEHTVLAVGEWIVDFLFAVDGYDEEGVLSCLYEIGAHVDVLHRADEVMERGTPNCGFMYGRVENKRAVVVIGPASSGEEFIDTFVHEVHHLAVLIASGLGIDLEGETPAYLAGDSARALADIVCRFGCPRCHS